MSRIDVVFKTANGYVTLEVENLAELDMDAPAESGVGVLAERFERPEDGLESPRLVIWWRSCADAERQAFEVMDSTLDAKDEETAGGVGFDRWLARNKAALVRECQEFAGGFGRELIEHVARQREEYQRAADEAHDLKAEKDEFMASMGVSMPPGRKSVAKKKAGKKRRS